MIKSGIRTLNQVIFFKRWRVGLATLVPTCIATISKHNIVPKTALF